MLVIDCINLETVLILYFRHVNIQLDHLKMIVLIQEVTTAFYI